MSDHLFITKDNFDRYREDAAVYAQQQANQLSSDIASLTKQVGLKEQEYKRAKDTVARSQKLAKHYDLDAISNELDAIKGDLGKLASQKSNIKRSELTFQQYLELFSSIGVKIPKIKDLSVLDEILRIFFLNFTVKKISDGKKQRYEVTSNLKEPWNGFLKSNEFDHGREEHLLLELFEYITKQPIEFERAFRDIEFAYKQNNRGELMEIVL